MACVKVTSALRSIGSVPFAQVLAEVAAKQPVLAPVAVGRDMQRLRCQLTILATGNSLGAPSLGAHRYRLDENVSETIADRSSKMLEAAQRLEAALLSSSALSAAEVRRLRREAAMTVHPDLCSGPYKLEAEELMKKVNASVAAALDRSSRA